jgi:hypothetical protein
VHQRIGRTLTVADFIDVPVNDPGRGYKSERLLERLAGQDSPRWPRLAGLR